MSSSALLNLDTCLGLFFLAHSLDAIADSQSFLFSLANPSGTEPVKITPKPGACGGMRRKKDVGPSFGTKEYYDLEVWRTFNQTNARSYLDLGYGFICPENADKKCYFTGKSPFDISELEVFKVNF